MQKLLVMLSLHLFATSLVAGMLHPHFSIGGRNTLHMTPLEPVQWSIKFLTHDNRLHTRFMRMHAKPMHMIVVSKDLNTFRHIHPYLGEDGIFRLPLHQPTDDPDNHDTLATIPRAGTYYVFTEVMPMPLNERMPMLMNRFAIHATTPSPEPTLSPLNNRNTTERVQYYQENGSLGQIGDYYKIEFDMKYFAFCGRWLPKFYFQLKTKQGTEYQIIENLQKWLGMGGHMILLDRFQTNLPDKTFRHLHAFLPMAEPGQFSFPYDHHKPSLTPGEYRAWGQFKHNNIVLTAQFNFQYEPPHELPEASSSPLCIAE